jgi:DNA replication and repair protein RecF
MHISRIILENFRNIELTDLFLDGRQQFFVGANGQGKTNLLEAIGYITALRSFRTSDPRLLITRGRDGAGMAYEVEHEVMDDTGVSVKLRHDGKEVTCDGEWVTKLGDFLGRFPTVVFSSQDQQLVRGSPGVRRRWLDLTIASMDTVYLQALQTYHRALLDRNRLLKRGAGITELSAFERPLAASAAQIVSKRANNLKILSNYVAAAYASIAGDVETASLQYLPDTYEQSTSGWTHLLERERPRDQVLKMTASGPHRDDFGLLLSSHVARDYGSEGQQRSLALALRLAQVNFFQERSGIQPVLLADDVLGELDPERRRRFWAGIGPDRQVIATGTTLPDAELGQWQIFRVEEGRFKEIEPTSLKR